MAIFVAQVANYFGLGNTYTRQHDGSMVLDTLLCTLGRYKIKIVQHLLLSECTKWKGQQVHTTHIEIVGVRSFSEGKRVIEDICALLSFISMSQVVAFEFSFKEIIQRYSVCGVTMLYRPLLDTADSSLVLSFLQQVWYNYSKLKRTRKLYPVLNMLTSLDASSRQLELKLAQAFIVIENLKGTYAQANNIPFAGGFFRRLSTPPKQNIKREKALRLEDLVAEMLRAVKMKHGLKRIVALRNEIIHFGLSRKSYPSMNSCYEKAQDIIREYLLRLLGYKGSFLVYSKASRIHKSLK